MKKIQITEKQVAKLVEHWKNQAKSLMNEDDSTTPDETTTDCRTEVGITVGLIDSLISISRILKNRIDTTDEDILGALADLRDDEDLKKILTKNEDK